MKDNDQPLDNIKKGELVSISQTILRRVSSQLSVKTVVGSWIMLRKESR